MRQTKSAIARNQKEKNAHSEAFVTEETSSTKLPHRAPPGLTARRPALCRRLLPAHLSLVNLHSADGTEGPVAHVACSGSNGVVVLESVVLSHVRVHLGVVNRRISLFRGSADRIHWLFWRAGLGAAQVPAPRVGGVSHQIQILTNSSAACRWLLHLWIPRCLHHQDGSTHRHFAP